MARATSKRSLHLSNDDASHTAQHRVLGPLALQIGLLNYHWNSAHIALMCIFSTLSFNGDGSAAASEWHKKKSDKEQRRLLRNQIENGDETLDPTAKMHIECAISYLDEEHNTRNSLIHSVFSFIPADKGWTLQPNLELGPKSQADLKASSQNIGLLKYVESKRIWMQRISTYTGQVLSYLKNQRTGVKMRRAAPKKPIVPSRLRRS